MIIGILQEYKDTALTLSLISSRNRERKISIKAQRQLEIYSKLIKHDGYSACCTWVAIYLWLVKDHISQLFQLPTVIAI